MAVPSSLINKPYRVVGKPHRVIQPGGTIVRFEVGDIIETLRLSDLVAFKDRFVPATQDEVQAYRQRQLNIVAGIDEAPLVQDAVQAATEQAALEAQFAVLAQQVDAAKHRTALAQQTQQEAENARHTVGSLVLPVKQLNPELFVLLRRSHAGSATLDEQEVVGPLVAYLEQHALGTATPGETEALEERLREFGLPLFVTAA